MDYNYLCETNNLVRSVINPEVLDEVKYIKSAPDASVAVLLNNYKQMPPYTFYSVKSPLNQSDEIYFVKFSHQRFLKAAATLKDRGDAEGYEQFKRLAGLFSAIEKNDKGYEVKDIVDTFMTLPYAKDYMSVEKLNRTQLFKLLATEIKLPLESIGKYFGEFDQEGSVDYKYKDAFIDFPSGAKEANKKVFLDIVKDIDGILTKHKMGYLITGYIRFVKLTGKAIGLYFQNSKDLKVSYAAKKSLRLRHTLIHELGHKYYYEFIPNLHSEISKKFIDLRIHKNIKHDNSKNDVQIKDLNQDILNTISVKDVLQYKGRTKRWQGDWIVGKIAQGKLWLTREYNENGPQVYQITATPSSLVDVGGWTSPNKEIAALFNKKILSPQESDDKTSDWFPTKYSTTSDVEWYAELFAFFMLDKLEGEPANWLKTTLYKK